ncbi:site-specific integrase [Ornithinimicrobium humiphilum]|uniref:Site-specific recombinase XerD n=1 Tax=Ornithinimicrobium humiphilum TaxID=125288 RepID=A0A543KQJ7_9MICO|nr:tyrosine-type recombinase/integrase [Ornithinimicrobium humiphilum]TQM97346.1 site-specific recombinase XerD [Ornithinimicrobium humiphilum]
MGNLRFKEPDKPLPRGIVRVRDRYRVRMDYEGKTHSLGMFDTITDAKAALSIAKADAARGIFVPPAERRAAKRANDEKDEAQAVTLKEWSEVWLARLEANPERSRATVLSYRSVMKNHVWPELGDVRLQDLTTQQVADHLGLLASRPSKRHPHARVNGVTPNVVIALRSCLNAAVKANAGGLQSFTFPEAPKHRRVRPEDEHGDVATPEEVRAMTEAMPVRLRIAVPLAAWCALRLGEILGLERRDLEHLDEPERAVLHVRRQFNVKANTLTPPKADSARTIAIPAALLPALRQHLDAYTPAARTGPVLAGPTGQRISQTTLDRHWRAAREEAGRPGFHFHNLRHTGLSAYAVQGATLAELLHRGGHTDVTVALRYQHATAARDRALTERLSREIAL